MTPGPKPHLITSKLPNAVHTMRNIGGTNNVWYYGYKDN